MTDFRGSGLLGLKHLWQFNIADSRAEKVFKVGTGQKTWYFFAATGINISGKVIEFIEEGKCDKYFYEQNEEINLYLLTQKLYNEFFYEFNELWIERGYTDFMKVNSTLEEFMMLKVGIDFVIGIIWLLARCGLFLVALNQKDGILSWIWWNRGLCRSRLVLCYMKTLFFKFIFITFILNYEKNYLINLNIYIYIFYLL